MSKGDNEGKSLNISQHSWNMKHIHSKDTEIEMILRKALWREGFRYRKNYKDLPGKPDIVLTKYKIAIFCDGEFFHGKDWDEKLKPKIEKGNNPEFWIKKIEKNQQRDEEINRSLGFMGWTVIRFWGNDIKGNVEQCVKTVKEIIFQAQIEGEE